MNEQLDKMLIECLDALDQGEMLEAILARYPQAAAQLRPLLETAVSLQRLPIQPTVAAQQRSKQQFLQTAAAMQGQKPAAAPLFWRRLQRVFRPLAGLAVVCLLLLVLIVPLSAAAVPGDALYTPKRFLEDMRLSLTSDGAAKRQLAAQYNQERIAEIETLLASGRTAAVAFHGPIESVGVEEWLIAGLLTQITPETAVLGEPAVGLWAEVSGQTQNGALIAFTILIPEGGNPNPERPAATPSPTVTATPTQEPTGTATATPTTTPTATATAAFTSTPTPTATAFPTLTPTETAVASPGSQPTSQPTNTVAPPANDNDSDDDNNNNDDDNNDNDNNNDNDDDNNNDNNDDNDNDD